ncbi:MAG: hypothetical protein V3R11_02640, partial [Nitrospirales bacterium]
IKKVSERFAVGWLYPPLRSPLKLWRASGRTLRVPVLRSSLLGGCPRLVIVTRLCRFESDFSIV